MSQSFEGEFEVEPGDFNLLAAPFIVRGDEVRFFFKGSDDNSWALEGAAIKQIDGTYKAERIKVNYDQHKVEEYMDVCFNIVSIVGGRCHIKGSLQHVGETYEMTADLAAFKHRK